MEGVTASPRLLAGTAILLAMLAAVVYVPSLSAPFVFDDLYTIRDNPAIRTLLPLSQALNPPAEELSFSSRPVIHLTMCVDYALWKLNPTGYHLTNLLFHALAVAALFLWLFQAFRAEKKPDAFFLALAAASLWALHPLNTSAVNYLTQRGELAVGLFLFILLGALHRSTQSAYPQGWRLLAVAACLLGMGSKENMLVAPLLAVLYDRMFLAQSWKEIVHKRGLFYLALAATGLWPIFRHAVYSPHVRPDTLAASLVAPYLLAQAWGLAQMLRLAAWPFPLVFDYGPLGTLNLSGLWPRLVLLAAAFSLTLWALFKKPRAGFCGACFFILLAPSVLIPITGQPIAEHRMYVPLAALITLLVASASQAGKGLGISRRAGLILLLLAGTALASATVARNLQYRSALELANDTLRKRPRNPRAWQNRGAYYHEHASPEKALADYNQALALDPFQREALANRSKYYFEHQNLPAALADLDQLIARHPQSAEAWARRAQLRAQQGLTAEALRDYQRATELRPTHPAYLNDRAWLLATAEDSSLRNGTKASELAEQAARLTHRDYRVLDTLAAAQAQAGNFTAARSTAEEALQKARAKGDEPFVHQLEKRILLYEQQKTLPGYSP